MDDLMIIELYFARDEQAIEETDTKWEIPMQIHPSTVEYRWK